MSQKSSGREGAGLITESETMLSSVDQLIADAENLAITAQREAVQREGQDIKSKKEASEQSAERAEELQRFFAGLSAEDAFVGNYAYEGVFTALEDINGVARPEKINELIQTLRKTESALRRLAVVESKSDALIENIEKLKVLHDQLFEKVQAATTEALEEVKKKYKGEGTELGKKYEQLLDSPLVRGIEQGADTPEAREKALKQEIVELFMRPVAEGRIKLMDQTIANWNGQIEEIEKERVRLREKNTLQPWEIDQIARNFGFRADGSTGVHNRQDLFGFFDQKVRGLRQKIEEFEPITQRNHLAFEHNRAVIDLVLEDEHDEDRLRKAFTELQGLISLLKEKNQVGVTSLSDSERSRTLNLKSSLAQTILGHYWQYGAAMPHDSRAGVEDRSLAGQILESGFSNYEKAGQMKDLFTYASRRAFGESFIPSFGEFVPSSLNLSPKRLAGEYAEVQQGKSPGILRKIPSFLEDYPSFEVFLGQFYSGESKFLNLGRAYRKADFGLQKKKAPNEELPEELAQIGWQESKLGAVVEPGQDSRSVDRGYAKVLERFSQPQMEAERAFDLQSSEGGFRVYTLSQAMDLLRRARRDSAVIVREMAEIKEGKTGGEVEIKRLEDVILKLKAELESVKGKSSDREKELSTQLGVSSEVIAKRDSKIYRLEQSNKKIVEEAGKIIVDTAVELEGALDNPGLWGRNLKKRVEDVAKRLRETKIS